MKKVINVSLSGRNFTLNEDAYNRLRTYLGHFETKLTVPEYQKREVMEEIEGRIAELFFQERGGDDSRVVTLEMVEKVTSALGMPDGSAENGSTSSTAFASDTSRRLYRDMENKRVAGVCSGLAFYFNADVTLLRILMLAALVFGSAGFWIYIILWIAVPQADTPAKKCEMQGIPPTAENMSRFARETYKK